MSDSAGATIRIFVNGEARHVIARSLRELLDDLNLDARMVVVEHNREIVRRAELEKTELREGDKVELVHFVGGG